MADKTAFCDVCFEQKELAANGTFKHHKTVLDGGDRWQPERTCPMSNRKPKK